MRRPGPDGQGNITGVEYSYVREDDEWQLTDSGGCSSEECLIEGQKALAKVK